MPSKTTKIDLAQQVAEYLSRTSEPRIPGIPDTTNGLSQQPIGQVPMHLRHLHNLIEDLSYDADKATREMIAVRELSFEADKATREMIAVRELFIRALRNHISIPEDVCSIELRKDWSVVPHIDGEAELSEMFAVALLGGHYH